MNRRQLFTRLSAIALAPLVKWLPKDELYPPGGVLPVITANTSDKGIGWEVKNIYCHPDVWKRLTALEPVPLEES